MRPDERSLSDHPSALTEMPLMLASIVSDYSGCIDVLRLRRMKLNFKFNFMKTMSMLEFRKHARKALAAVQRGERLLLTYRGRPVAQLSPVRETQRDVPPHDPLRHLDAFAFDGPGRPLTNEAIDRIVYGT
ncbi:MAG: type II toxin-antitoxin system Phd/YefM family antitoxin [Gemmatimonadota bacterium]